MEKTIRAKWKFYIFWGRGIKKFIRDSRIKNPDFQLCLEVDCSKDNDYVVVKVLVIDSVAGRSLFQK